jgi:hypothetical protein
MGGQDHRGALRQLPDQPAHLAHLGRVEPVGRLVEDDDIGIVQNRLRHADPLAVAARERLDPGGGLLGQRRAPDRPGDRRIALGAGHAAEIGVIGQEVDHRHLGPDRAVFRQIADPRLDRPGIPAHLEIVDADRARGRLQIAGQHLHDRALAGAVVAQKADDLALGDLETDPVHGREAAVEPGQGFHVDHGRPPFASLSEMAERSVCRATGRSAGSAGAVPVGPNDLPDPPFKNVTSMSLPIAKPVKRTGRSRRARF